MKIQPSIPKGTRDFSPEILRKRNYIFDTIRNVFELYGFQPIETPVMEKLSTLTGKYGEEGDRLIFKVLNSGDYLSKVSRQEASINDLKSNELASELCEKALRYDLTIPFARYVVMHQNEITFPFKRYQIQPVWRADRPQKGRYREFYQCDVDVVGSDSLLNEVELVQIYDTVFAKLNIPVTIKVNNRKILTGIAEVLNIKEQFQSLVIAIDKLDKIGLEGVLKELREKGFEETTLEKLSQYLKNPEQVNWSEELKASTIGMKGVEELEYIKENVSQLGLANDFVFDPTLARGLDYYTGMIFEVKANNVSIGSIGGGGRYDDLTGLFGLSDISGVGISFGADRIYDVMEELKLFPESTNQSTEVMFANFDEASVAYSLPILKTLREESIKAEVYPDADKMKKQFKYADSKGIKFVVMAGSDEMTSGEVTLKNMVTGDQEAIKKEDLTKAILK